MHGMRVIMQGSSPAATCTLQGSLPVMGVVHAWCWLCAPGAAAGAALLPHSYQDLVVHPADLRMHA